MYLGLIKINSNVHLKKRHSLSTHLIDFIRLGLRFFISAETSVSGFATTHVVSSRIELIRLLLMSCGMLAHSTVWLSDVAWYWQDLEHTVVQVSPEHPNILYEWHVWWVWSPCRSWHGILTASNPNPINKIHCFLSVVLSLAILKCHCHGGYSVHTYIKPGLSC